MTILILLYLAGFGMSILRYKEEKSLRLCMISFIVSPILIPISIGTALEKYHTNN